MVGISKLIEAAESCFSCAERVRSLLGARVEVALDPGLRRAQVLAIAGLVARQQREARVQQPQAQVLAQEIGLRRRQERRLGRVDLRAPPPAGAVRPTSPTPRRDQNPLSGSVLGGSGRTLAALVEGERQRIDRGHHAVDARAHAGDVEHRQRLQALDVARQRAPHRQELRPVGLGEARLGELQSEQRGAHVAGELQLLRGDGEHLLDLGELPLVAVARELLVKRLERELLALRLGEPRLELRRP